MEPSAIGEVLILLFIGSLVCGLPLLAVTLLLARTMANLRARGAAQRLAQAGGLAPLNRAGTKMQTWYGGVHQGHRFAVKPSAYAYYTYVEGRRRRSLSMYLRVAMEVRVPRPGNAIAYRSHKNGGVPQDFDEAFPHQENAARLTQAARDAMLGFVYKGYPTGLTKTLTLRLRPGTRNLRLRDRASAPAGLLDPEVLIDTHVILVHEHPDPFLAPDAFRSLLDEMAAVAEAIETGRASTSPAGRHLLSQTPPDDGWAKYAPWAAAASAIFGLPSLLCFCAVAVSLI